MRLGLHQSARLEQRLIQSPQMIQAMQVLQLGTLDLSDRIEQELVENPFLEVAENEKEGDSERASEAEAADPATDGLESMLDDLERMERDFGDGRLSRVNGAGDGEDSKYEAMQNAPAGPASLAQAVLATVSLMEVGEREKFVLEYISWSLDGRGYLRDSLETLAEEIDGALREELAERGEEVTAEAPTEEALPYEPVSATEVEMVLLELRLMTHPALGAQDLREALLLQLPGDDAETLLARRIVEEHLDDWQANRLPRIVKSTGATMGDVKAAMELIKTLDPSPGRDYGEARAEVITPEVIVERLDGEFVVRLDRERVPDLVISPTYKSLLAKAGDNAEARAWIKKRFESAGWFIDAVRQRQSTLGRIARVVFRHQQGFLDKGLEGLRTLRMQEVADELGVHISTISRGVAGKHAQTPRGIYPLKFFFTGGTEKDTGEVASQASVMDEVRKLIEDEDKAAPLSDEQLAARLAEKKGITIARRTVTKYRKGLGIPPSTQRKQY